METMSAAAVNESEALAILAEPNVIAVGARGDEERRRRHGLKTTFVRVFEIHVTAPLVAALGR
jgi:hypothetical protein